jgi:hypothetical protein
MDPASDWVLSGGKGALDFDGVNDFVVARQTHTLNAISSSVWARAVAGPSAFGYVVDLSTESSVVAGIGTNSDASQIRWVLNDGTNTSICDLSVNQPANRLNHWLGTWDGRNAVFYLNGVQVASTTSTRVLSQAAQNLYVGRLRSADRYMLGQIDDVTIFNAALTASEVAQVYKLGRGYGVFPEPDFDEGFAAAGFKAYWANRRSQLIGGGV